MTSSTHPLGSWRRPAALLTAAAALCLGAVPAWACELDGLSHGYGPMSAIFAGAHRYQALNGLEDEETPPAEPPTVDAPADAAARTTPSAPPTPRRSFVAWAKAKPKPAADAAGAETPATWTRASSSAEPSGAAPQQPEAEQREGAQRPPRGGSVP
jgi:hypothetical protein